MIRLIFIEEPSQQVEKPAKTALPSQTKAQKALHNHWTDQVIQRLFSKADDNKYTTN